MKNAVKASSFAKALEDKAENTSLDILALGDLSFPAGTGRSW